MGICEIVGICALRIVFARLAMFCVSTVSASVLIVSPKNGVMGTTLYKISLRWRIPPAVSRKTGNPVIQINAPRAKDWRSLVFYLSIKAGFIMVILILVKWHIYFELTLIQFAPMGIMVWYAVPLATVGTPVTNWMVNATGASAWQVGWAITVNLVRIFL